jgi:hypothetical protein
MLTVNVDVVIGGLALFEVLTSSALTNEVKQQCLPSMDNEYAYQTCSAWTD